jgi:peptide deformylase
LEILAYPHPTLRHKSKPLRKVDAELKKIVSEMFELMYAHNGIGLAANQVDLPLRFFILNLTGKKGEGEEMVFLNPVISSPKGSEEAEEGCLSLPGLYGNVIRPKQVRVNAYSLDGQEFHADVTGLMGRCIQHETDHLDGVLFTDRMNPTARADIAYDLHEFETAFESSRATGGIPSAEQIAARLAELEKKYC